jgi:uncharacterized membrane protein
VDGVNGTGDAGRAQVDRLAAFSDAVIAIAMTLLVLGFAVPRGLSESNFVAALAHLWPQLFSFALSFWVIGRFWRSHHRMFQYVRAYDDRLPIVNSLFLLAVVFLPFPTAVLGDYLDYRAAFVFYAAGVALAGFLFALLWVYVAFLGRLVTDDLDPRLRRAMLLRYLSGPVVFSLSVPLAMAGWLRETAVVWVVLPAVVRRALRWRYDRARG